MPDTAATSPKTPIIPALRRLVKLSGPNQVWLYLALGIDLVQAVLVVVLSAYFRQIFNAVTTGDQALFVSGAIVTVAIAVVGIPLTYARVRCLGRFSERTLADLRQTIAERINHLPVGYLEERHSGDFMSVINADLLKIKNLTGRDLLDLIGQISRGLLSLAYIISISWLLTLVSLVTTPFVFIFLSRLSNPITSRTSEMQAEIGELNAIAQDGLSGIAITRSFNLTRIIDQRYDRLNQRVVQKGLSIARLRSGVDVISSVVGFTPFLITFAVGGGLAVAGRLTFGDIFAFINLLNYVVNPLGAIPRLVANISEAVGALQRVFDLLDHDLEPVGGSLTQPTIQAGSVVRLNNLSFAYADGTPVLKGIDLDILPGEMIAVVGPSGSGKSTIIKTLLGFYPSAVGAIELFGEELNRWQLSAARQQMAFVAQDTYLFPVSIRENIACGKLDANQAEIEAAAIAANIHDFIRTLPDGYQTLVGERGARLSGGQKQRISLARAILKDAPILLLDEPTSALDSESEALVQEALDRFMASHTSIVIAHRLSTIKDANRVIVLADGQIIEQGTHAALLAAGGLYQELYQRQFDSLPPDHLVTAGGAA